VLQRPQAKLDLTESSPFVLTELGGERAELEFPSGSEALYLVYAVGSQSIVAEVYALPDRAVRIVLPKGRYVIQKRLGAGGAAADVVLRGGGTHVLSPADFRAFEPEKLAQKGGMIVRPWSIDVVDSVLAGSQVDIGDDLAVRLARRETWGYSLGPLAGVAKRHTAYNDVTELSAGGEASVDRFFTLSPPLLLRAGVDLRGAWISQSVRRNDADHATLAGFPATTHYSGTALGGGLHAGARFSLGAALYIDAGARALALGVNTSAGIEVRLLAGGELGVGFAL
jgi:hypothetical protein